MYITIIIYLRNQGFVKLTLEETREGGISSSVFLLSVYLGCKVIFQMVMGCVSRDIAEEILEKCVLMV